MWRSATGQEVLEGRRIGLNVDPLFANWARSVTVNNPALLQSLGAYRLKPNSPLIGTGLDLLGLFKIDQGPTDFFGNPIPRGAYSIGAHLGK
jgi:hypothetical protein